MTLKYIYSVSFLDLLVLGLFVPLIQPYLLTVGASELQIGVLESICSLLSFLTGPIIGSLSDSKGRKFMLASSLTISFVGFALIGSTKSLIPFIIGRLLYAISNKVQIITKTLIADFAPKEKQSECYAKLGALSAAGFIAGPVVGGYLYQASNDLSYLSGVILIFLMLSCGILLLIPSQKQKTADKKVDILQILKNTFSNFTKINWTVFWDVMIIKFLAEASFMTFYTSLGITLKEFGASQINIGYVFGLHTILLVVGNLAINKFTNKFYKEDNLSLKQQLHAFTVLLATKIGFYFAPNYLTYILLVIPLSLVRALIDSVQMKNLLKKMDEKDKGVIMGAYESILPFVGFVLPLVSGIASHFAGRNVLNLLGIPPAAFAVLVTHKISKTMSQKNKTN